MDSHTFRKAGAMLLIGFVFVAALACASAAPVLSEPCGGMHVSPVLCPAMMPHRTIMHSALPAFSMLILAFIVAAFALFSLRHIKEYARTARVCQRVPRPRQPEPLGMLTELFSQGILHPQLYG